MKDITTFDEHLDKRYGEIGSEKRTEFEIKAKAFAIGELRRSKKRCSHDSRGQDSSPQSPTFHTLDRYRSSKNDLN